MRLTKKKMLFGLFAVVLALGLPLSIMQLRKSQDIRQRASSTDITISANPATGEAVINNEFPVDFLIDTKGKDVTALELIFSYNKDVLQISKVEFTGTQFSDGLQSQPNNSTGTYHIFAVVNAFGTVNGGQIKIVRLYLKGVAAGDGTISLSKADVGVFGQESPPPVNIVGGTYKIVQSGINISVYPPSGTTTPAQDGCDVESNKPENCICKVSLNQCAPSFTCVDYDDGGMGVCKPNASPTPSSTPSPTCTPRPACLDTEPKCLPAEPIGGWCPTTSITPTGSQCFEGNTICPSLPISLTPIPTSTPFPSPTISQDETVLNFSVKIPAIGPNSFENKTPIHPQRQIQVEIFNDQNQPVPSIPQGLVTYSSSNGQFQGNVLLGSTIQSGSYSVKLKLNNTLKKFVPGIVSIIKGGKLNAAPAITLISGDLDSDNKMTILDYNIMTACTNRISTCGEEIKLLADLDDNGIIDGADLNLLYTAYGVRNGD